MANCGGMPVRCRGRRDFVIHSRIGMLRALNATSNSSRKDAHWGPRKIAPIMSKPRGEQRTQILYSCQTSRPDERFGVIPWTFMPLGRVLLL
jgi:hypothetical protein